MTSSGPTLFPDIRNVPPSRRGPARLNACVRWARFNPRDLHPYTDGYRSAAVALYEHIEQGASPDYLFFPLCFLWRHHFELVLKEIILHGRAREGAENLHKTGHPLKSLWAVGRPFVEQLESSDDDGQLETAFAIIAELDHVDPVGDGFRYPLDWKNAQANLTELPEWVNVRDLQEQLVWLASFLSGALAEIQARLNYERTGER